MLRAAISYKMAGEMPPRDNISAALALMSGAILLIAAMDAAAKILTETLPLAVVVWGRFAFHSLWLLPAALYLAGGRRRSAHFRGGEIPGHLLRGLCIAGATAFYFAAISKNPIPDALAVFFVEPIFVMFLAAAFLGERLRARRIAAAAVAFAGVLVVLRPGGGRYDASILFALLAGLCFAAYIVATRMFAVRGSAAVNSWGAAAAAMLWCSPFAFWEWRTPTDEWAMLILLGGLAAGGHLLFAFACRFADASLIGVFHYSEIIAAAAISYALFSHIPDAPVWGGFALIAGAKIILVVSEARDKKPPPQ